MTQERTRTELALARQQVAACGESLAARLVFADLLTERGDPRGLFITAQCSGNEEAAAALLRRHRKHLLHPLPIWAEVKFKNGFIDTWTTGTSGLRASAKRLLRTTPLRQLSINGARTTDLQFLLHLRGFEHVRVLELINPWRGALDWLASLEKFSRLRTLSVVGNWSAAERQGLLESRLREKLETLEFTTGVPAPRLAQLA